MLKETARGRAAQVEEFVRPRPKSINFSESKFFWEIQKSSKSQAEAQPSVASSLEILVSILLTFKIIAKLQHVERVVTIRRLLVDAPHLKISTTAIRLMSFMRLLGTPKRANKA